MFVLLKLAVLVQSLRPENTNHGAEHIRLLKVEFDQVSHFLFDMFDGAPNCSYVETNRERDRGVESESWTISRGADTDWQAGQKGYSPLCHPEILPVGLYSDTCKAACGRCCYRRAASHERVQNDPFLKWKHCPNNLAKELLRLQRRAWANRLKNTESSILFLCVRTVNLGRGLRLQPSNDGGMRQTPPRPFFIFASSLNWYSTKP